MHVQILASEISIFDWHKTDIQCILSLTRPSTFHIVAYVLFTVLIWPCLLTTQENLKALCTKSKTYIFIRTLESWSSFNYYQSMPWLCYMCTQLHVRFFILTRLCHALDVLLSLGSLLHFLLSLPLPLNSTHISRDARLLASRSSTVLPCLRKIITKYELIAFQVNTDP